MESVVSIQNWITLQKSLKQYKQRLEQEDCEQRDLLTQLKALTVDYGKQQVYLRELICKSVRPKQLTEISSLGVHAKTIENFVFYIKDHLEVLALLAHESKPGTPWLDLLAETYAFSFYEDLLQPEGSEFEFLRLIGSLIVKESKSKDCLYDLFNETILGKLLPLYTKSRTQRMYVIETFGRVLLKIVYGDQRDLRLDTETLQALYRKVRLSRDTWTSLPSPKGIQGRFSRTMERMPTIQEVEIETCLNDYEVMASVRHLSELLIDRCRMILSEIYSKVDLLPYGVRWICRVISDAIAEISHDFEADRLDILGTFLFAKWWLPALISADSNGLLQDCDVPQVIRQNLTLVSNVVKHVFRGTSIEEPQYKHVNEFIREETPRLREYIARIVDIPDLVIASKASEAQVSYNTMASYYSKGECPIEKTSLRKRTRSNGQNDLSTQMALISIAEVKGLVELVISLERDLIMQGHEDLVTLAAAIKTAQQLDDLFVEADHLHESYFMLLKNDCKDSNETSKKASSKLISNVKEATIDLLLGFTHFGPILASGQDISLVEIVQFISDSPSLFSNKREKESQIPVKLLARYLRSNLSSLPDHYKSNKLALLYKELTEEQRLTYKSKKSKITANKQRLLYAIEVLTTITKQTNTEIGLLEAYDSKKELKQFAKTSLIPICIFHHKTPEKSRLVVTKQKECLHLRLEYLETLNSHTSKPNAPRFSMRVDSEKKSGHVCSINEFADEFARLDPVTQSTETSEDPDKVSQAFFQYIAILREEVVKSFPRKSPEDQERLVDDLENYMLRKMFAEVFPSWPSLDDTHLHLRTLELDWLAPEHLDIIRGDVSMWKGALDALRQIDNFMTPASKLACLVEFMTTACDLLFLHSFKEVVSSDDSLPVIIYLIVKAQPLRLHSNINFISKFRHQRKLLADSGFCLSQIQSAVAFIEQADSNSLSISESEFRQNVNEARARHHPETN